MARVWIEPTGEQACWSPTRALIAKLSHDGYVCQVLIGTRVQTIIVTGRKLAPSELVAIGHPPGSSRLADQPAR